MRETITKKRHRREFDSWGEYLDYLKQPCPDDGSFTRWSRRADGLNEHWCPDSWAEVERMSVEGWPAGLKQARVLADPLVDKVSSLMERIDPYYTDDPTGALDVARYLDCEPECWVGFQPRKVDGPGRKHLTVLFNQAASGGIKSDALIRKGALVSALVELLELAGFRVRVLLGMGIGCTCCRSREYGELEPDAVGHLQEVVVPVKEHDQPLDMDRLVFALAHPGSFRVLGFSSYEHLPEEWRRRFGVHDSTYGRVTRVTDQADIVIRGAFGYGSEKEWTDEPAGRKWVLDQLKAQGVEVREEQV